MKGDIAFAGFMLTADEWQELDVQSRAQLIAVATRRADPWLERPRRTAEGTGPHEVVEVLDAELLEDDIELLADGDFVEEQRVLAEIDALATGEPSVAENELDALADPLDDGWTLPAPAAEQVAEIPDEVSFADLFDD